MTPANANSDWLYILVGSFLVGTAALLLAWALLWDRSRGRRRCPKCWYDMSGCPGLQCPECGRTAKGERKLAKTRRRWNRASVAAGILVVGLCATSVPTYQRGWVRLVPTILLAYGAPADDPVAMAARSLRTGSAGTPKPVSPGNFPQLPQGLTWQTIGAPPPPTLSAQLTAEFWRRLGDHRVPSWLASPFLARYFRRIGFDFSSLVDLPGHWPVGEPILVQARREPLPGSAGAPEVFVRLATGPTWVADNTRGFIDPVNAPTESLNLVLELRSAGCVLYRTDVLCAASIKGDVSTFLDRVDDAEATARVEQALSPHLVWLPDGEAVVRVRDRSRSEPWPSIDFSLAFQVDLRQGDRILGTGAGISEWKRPVWKDWDELRVAWAPGGREIASQASGRITLLVHGDPTAAGKSYVRYPFGRAMVCWAGRFEVPAESP